MRNLVTLHLHARICRSGFGLLNLHSKITENKPWILAGKLIEIFIGHPPNPPKNNLFWIRAKFLIKNRVHMCNNLARSFGYLYNYITHVHAVY